MNHIFKHKGQHYQLDTGRALRLVQRVLTDRTGSFSRADRGELAAILEGLIFKVVSAESEMEKRDSVARQTELDSGLHQILYEEAVHITVLSPLLDKLRTKEEILLNDIIPNHPEGSILAKRVSAITVLFDGSELVYIRAFYVIDKRKKEVIVVEPEDPTTIKEEEV